MSTRDLDGVLAAIDAELMVVKDRYGGGLSQDQYMRNVGREDALKDLRDAVLAIKRRGGDDEAEPRPARRARRGVSTETSDWGPTPGDVLDIDPFR